MKAMYKSRLRLLAILLFALAFQPVALAVSEGALSTKIAQATHEAIPFTLSDRDRLVRLEEGQKSLQRQMDDLKVTTQRQTDDIKASTQRQMEGLELRIDDIRNLIYVILAGMFTLVGFILWDRRTMVVPIAKKNLELEAREERMELALKAYAEVEPRMAEVLRKRGLM